MVDVDFAKILKNISHQPQPVPIDDVIKQIGNKAREALLRDTRHNPDMRVDPRDLLDIFHHIQRLESEIDRLARDHYL